MRILLTSVLIASIFASGCGRLIVGVVGNGVSKTEKRDISSFTELKVDTPCLVEVVEGEKPTLKSPLMKICCRCYRPRSMVSNSKLAQRILTVPLRRSKSKLR